MCAVVLHRLDRDAVLTRLRRYAERELGGRPEVREVTLFGSLARDDYSARSDADVVVIVDAAEVPGPARSPDYMPREPISVSVDVLVYTPEEQRLWRPRFRREVAAGITLYRRGAPA